MPITSEDDLLKLANVVVLNRSELKVALAKLERAHTVRLVHQCNANGLDVRVAARQLAAYRLARVYVEAGLDDKRT